MLKEILNKLIYIDILVKLLFPSIILSNWLLSAAIFYYMVKESIDVCTVCTWQNKYSVFTFYFQDLQSRVRTNKKGFLCQMF